MSLINAKSPQYTLHRVAEALSPPSFIDLQVSLSGIKKVSVQQIRQESIGLRNQIRLWQCNILNIEFGAVSIMKQNQVLLIIFIKASLQQSMDNRLRSPNFLDIQEELYPEITLHKQIIFENDSDGFSKEVFTRVFYDSFAREIDLTQTINSTLFKFYGEAIKLQIFILNEQMNLYDEIGCFPSQDSFKVGEQFLEASAIFIKVKKFEEQVIKTSDSNENACPIIGGNIQIIQVLQGQQELKDKKGGAKRTIKEILTKVEEWRKIYMQSGCKISLQEAADILTISKRSLEDYITLIKLGEKYGFPFEQRLNERANQLRKFIKEKHQTKKEPTLSILSRFTLNK